MFIQYNLSIYIRWAWILKNILLTGFMVKKFGDRCSKLPHNTRVFVGFFVLLLFPIGKPLYSHVTLNLKHWEQTILQFWF